MRIILVVILMACLLCINVLATTDISIVRNPADPLKDHSICLKINEEQYILEESLHVAIEENQRVIIRIEDSRYLNSIIYEGEANELHPNFQVFALPEPLFIRAMDYSVEETAVFQQEWTIIARTSLVLIGGAAAGIVFLPLYYLAPLLYVVAVLSGPVLTNVFIKPSKKDWVNKLILVSGGVIEGILVSVGFFVAFALSFTGLPPDMVPSPELETAVRLLCLVPPIVGGLVSLLLNPTRESYKIDEVSSERKRKEMNDSLATFLLEYEEKVNAWKAEQITMNELVDFYNRGISDFEGHLSF